MGDKDKEKGEGGGDWKELADPIKDKMGDIPKVDDGAISSVANDMIDVATKAREEELDKLWDAFQEDPQYADAERPADWHAKREDYEWIPSYFEPFYDRPLGGASGMADNLKTAKSKLEGGQSSVYSSAADEVGKWAGDARDEFKNNFLDTFPVAINNQKQVLDELRAGLYAYEAIQRKGRENAKNIAQKTKEALEPEGFSFKSSEAKLMYAMLGVTFWVASTAASVGLAGLVTTPGILTLLGASQFGLSGAANYEPTELEISGATVDTKLQTMVDKLNQLQREMFEEESTLSQAIGRSCDGVEGVLGRKKSYDLATLLPNEPAGGTTDLTSGKKPSEEEFHPPAEAR